MPARREASIGLCCAAEVALAACNAVLGLDDLTCGAVGGAPIDGSSDAAIGSTSLEGGAGVGGGEAPDGGVVPPVQDAGTSFDAPVVLTQATAPQALAVDDARLYWGDEDGPGGASIRSIARKARRCA